jgi:hypothetical protein
MVRSLVWLGAVLSVSEATPERDGDTYGDDNRKAPGA